LFAGPSCYACSEEIAVPYQLRDYRPGDLRRLWEIDQQCFARGIAYSQRELLHYIQAAGAFTLVAETSHDRQKPSVVGFLVAHALSRGVGHVVTIDVLGEARRGGLGSQLMSECEARLRSAGCTAVYLETAVDNAAALHFYKRQGYAVLKTIPRYYLDSIDALLMGKRLLDGK
jgi:ribosomal-protein-alanine N-acetyltransferase